MPIGIISSNFQHIMDIAEAKRQKQLFIDEAAKTAFHSTWTAQRLVETLEQHNWELHTRIEDLKKSIYFVENRQNEMAQLLESLKSKLQRNPHLGTSMDSIGKRGGTALWHRITVVSNFQQSWRHRYKAAQQRWTDCLTGHICQVVPLESKCQLRVSYWSLHVEL